MTLFLFIVGLVLLIGGAEILVRGATRIATAAGIAPLVVGLTVVAFGTSAPELAVSTAATLRGDAGLAVGNVIGSNILNVLLILGVSAAVAPLVVQKRVVRLEVPFMIGVSALVVLLALDGTISRTEGLLLLLGGATYTAVLVVQARRAGNGSEAAVAAAAGETGSAALAPGWTPLGLAGDMALIAAGLGLLVLGSHWIVQGAQALAGALGVPDLVIGLTVVSAGTSLPELATSVIAAFRGQRDIAVGNIIGSNIFNLLIIMGAAAAVVPEGVAVPLSALTFDLPVMLAVAVACLPIFFTGHRIDRLEGVVFLAFYVVYTTYLILFAAHHHALDEFREAMLLVGIPLTLLVLVLSWKRGASDSDGR
jgi:cation:H+ antiporter